MGAGGDGTPLAPAFMRRNSWSLDRLKSLGDVKDDLVVLRHLWFSKAKGDDHAARLESFYGPQAAACKHNPHSGAVVQFCFVNYCTLTTDCVADDKFRSRFLWGRRPMLAAAAARLAERNNLVWVDLGGGTGVGDDLAELVHARPLLVRSARHGRPYDPLLPHIARLREVFACHATSACSNLKMLLDCWV